MRRILSYVYQNIGPYILPHTPDKILNFNKPSHVIVEPTNFCNLKCVLCPTANNMRRNRGYLKLDDFKYIINEISPYIKRIDMNFAGEPLLNRNIADMVEYASQNGIYTYISTNGMLLDRYAEKLCHAGLDFLDIAIDGATPESYTKYRKRGNFLKVIENSKRIIDIKKSLGTSKPVIRLQFVVMKHNEHEINDIISLSKSIGFDAISLKSMSLGSWIFDINRKLKLADEFLPKSEKYVRYLYDKNRKILKIRNKPKICSWFRKTVFLWNGDVTICCYDFNGEYVVGNIFSDTFEKIWNSTKYNRYRKYIISRKLDLCKNCSLTYGYSKTIKFTNNM